MQTGTQVTPLGGTPLRFISNATGTYVAGEFSTVKILIPDVPISCVLDACVQAYLPKKWRRPCHQRRHRLDQRRCISCGLSVRRTITGHELTSAAPLPPMRRARRRPHLRPASCRRRSLPTARPRHRVAARRRHRAAAPCARQAPLAPSHSPLSSHASRRYERRRASVPVVLYSRVGGASGNSVGALDV